MSDVATTLFWQRSGNPVQFNGVTQSQPDSCIFASVAGAINHLNGRAVMSERDLLNDHSMDGCPPVSFGRPLKYAIGRSHVSIEQWERDTASGRPLEQEVDGWLAAGGLVIASLEIVPSPIPGQQAWHMLTLVAKDATQYQVWDTAPGHGCGFVTWPELDQAGLDYDGGQRLLPHQKRHMLFLRRRQ